MALWKKFWLLLSAIWLVVALLQVVTILAFSEETSKIWQPLLLAFAVPAVAYVLGWAWSRFLSRPSREEKK